MSSDHFKARIKSSNVCLGFDEVDYTASSHSYSNPGSPSQNLRESEAKKDLRQTHWSLGIDKTPYETSNKLIDPRSIDLDNSRLSVEAKNDLRAAHFELGHDDVNYESMFKTFHGDDKKNDFDRSKGSDTKGTYFFW